MALLFIDGVGIGPREPEHNPLARADLLLSRFLDAPDAPLAFGGRARAVDPTFGIPGRPQSASNQTALLTGLPAPALIGRHVLGYPDRALRELLAAHSLVRGLVRAGRRATFANGYPSAYLEALGLEAAKAPPSDDLADPPLRGLTDRRRRHLRPSASTLAFAAAPVPLRTLQHVRAGEALTHDVRGRVPRAMGLRVPERTPEAAAQTLLSLSDAHDFTFFEHYLADVAGHAQDGPGAESALGDFDALLRTVVRDRPEDLTVLVVSDHGNVEDLSVRQHTLNPVPLLAFGPGASELDDVHDLADVGRLVLRLLDAPEPKLR